jgi:hypothetical protein
MYVLVRKGRGAGRVLTNIEFPCVHSLKRGATTGLFIMVNGEGLHTFPQRNFRVMVDSEDDVSFSATPHASHTMSEDGEPITDPAAVTLQGHSARPASMLVSTFSDEWRLRDEEPVEVIRDRMIERFAALSQLSVEVARGTLRGLVVYGSPGVGKSHEVEESMIRVNAFNKFKFLKEQEELSNGDTGDTDGEELDEPVGYSGSHVAVDPTTGVEIPQVYSYFIQKGHLTASGLYNLLYNNRRPNEILIFDDSDSVLGDETSISMLKSALDTTTTRNIMWTVSGERRDGIPQHFVFEGSIIFITNTNFELLAKSQNKIAPHIEAILDRCLYLDLMLDTTNEKLVRIDYVCRDLKMVEKVLLAEPTTIDAAHVDEICEELLQWTHDNAHNFRDLSLRKVHHLATLRRGSNWQRLAEMTLLRGRR